MDFKSPLLNYPYTKRAGLLSILDFDDYDSEIATDLMALHDEILNNPVRGYVPEYQNSYGAQRVWNFTMNSLKSRLLPEIQKAMKVVSKKAKDQIKIDIDDAIEQISLAQHTLDMTNDYGKAGPKLETAFSHLHDAIEVIKADTRRVPKGKKIQPRQPAKDFYSSLNTASAEESDGSQ
jgi:hypothetical protein